LLRKLGGDGVKLRFCYEAGRAVTAFNARYRQTGTNASSWPPR
jgi:hypothetical protein